MSYGLQIEAWGDYALFTRPEFKTERVSYEVMTPSAARGIIESIYWHPGFSVKIDRIHVLNDIRFANIVRNEVKGKASAGAVRKMILGGPEAYISTRSSRTQRSSLVLKDVRYVIDAHFEIHKDAWPGATADKIQGIYHDRIAKGRCYSQPYFGTREFLAHYRLWEGGKVPAIRLTRDLGVMLYDLDYTDKENILPTFFIARLSDGVVQVAGERVLR